MSQSPFRHISLQERQSIADNLRAHKSSSRATPRRLFKLLLNIVVVAFSLVGVGFVGVYASVNLHLTNTDGIVDKQVDGFWANETHTANTASVLDAVASDTFFNSINYCRLKILKDEYPGTFWRILNLALNGKKDLALNNLNVAMSSMATTSSDSSSDVIACNNANHENVSQKSFENLTGMVDHTSPLVFASSTEWAFFKSSVLKDTEVLKRVEKETGIKSRIIVSELVAEQLRLFYTSRAWFKRAISPLNVLVSMSQFSWGVLGIKEQTAETIENNLKNYKSPYYLGPEYEHLLDFTTDSVSRERFKRITDYSDHYYGYLYAALFDKQIITQWKASGFDISNRPEIIATIYNIGFAHSSPNADPQMGGAELNIAGKTYSFGKVAYNFYYSGELLDQFPQ